METKIGKEDTIVKKQIGWFNLALDTVYRNDFEFAAWYEEVEVKAGRYPIEVYDYREDSNHEVEGHIRSAYVTMPGTIVSDYFAGHYCGVPISGYDTGKNAGKESSHTMQTYLYDLASSVLDGTDFIELLPEYEAREIKFTYDGKEHVTHGIFRKAA